MTYTASNLTGDGVTTDRLEYMVELPDSGSSVIVSGTVQKAGGTAMAITGSPVAAPADPAGGHTRYWICQVDKGTGAATVKFLDDSVPTPDTGSDGTPMEVVCTQSITSTTSDLATTLLTTPDTY